MGCYGVSKTDADRDGIPDWWVLRYFGHATGLSIDGSLAGEDADGTGQNNLYKYVAGLDPTNPASVFLLQLSAVTNQPTQYNLMFSPWARGRTYSPQFSTGLVGGVWLPLPGYAGPVTNGNQVTIIDTNASGPQRFYRIDITYLSEGNATTAPSIPSGAAAAANSISQVTVTWAASTDFSGFGLAGYQVYRDGVLIATTTDTSFSESGLSANTQYCYTIVAYDNAGNISSASSQICVTTLSPSPTDPSPPSNQAVTVMTSTSITIKWQDNSNNELGFQIQQATSSGGPWSVVGTVGANVTSFTDLGLNSSTTYYYQVAAFN
jgi:chitodextrinase